MPRLPSPCIDVCKFRREGPGGRHCIGCSMTKPQKRLFKAVRGPQGREALLRLVMVQQGAMGRYDHWTPAYARRCRKKGATPPA